MTPFNDLFEEMSVGARLANAARTAVRGNATRRVVRSAADDLSAATDLTPHASRIEPGQLAAQVSLGGLSLVRQPMKAVMSA